MIIVTKTGTLEIKYYKCTCPKCGAEFVFDETDFIRPFLPYDLPYICCPNPKCNKTFDKTDCELISKSQYEEYLPPKKRILRPNTSNPAAKNTI